MKNKIKIGITGGIGAGKSVICRFLSIIGFSVYDTDYYAKYLINKDVAIVEKLKKKYSDDIYINNEINRGLLASIIFNDENELLYINSIVHPRVREHFNTWCNNQPRDIIFIESAILFESGLNKILDYVWFVKTNQDTRIKRVMKRDQCDKDSVLRRIEKQMCDIEKEQKSDFIILNDEHHLILPTILKAISNLEIS